ncbi:MAG: diguanylate cyclase [Rhodocyclaceae bacterium]|nr:diguanylate cyclase [Rhodocyclaceae bacterium]
MEIDDVRDILPLFLNHSHAAVAIKDLEGRYLFANGEFQRYAGVGLERIFGQRDESFLDATRTRLANEAEQAILNSRRGRSGDECIVRDGSTLSYLVARFPIFNEHHQIVAVGLIGMEITPEQRDSAAAERALKEAQLVNAQLRGAIFALEELASTDRLTNAWNRRRYEETIEGEIHRSARYGHPLSMLLIDVDHFKRINDLHGHQEGDRVLVQVSTLVRSIMRKSDSLTRWGGEEFIVLMPNTGLGRAQATAQRICDTVAAHPLDTIGHLTVSVGVAEYLPSETHEEWLARADRAMYRAKDAGRNRIDVDPSRSMTQSHVEHLEGNFVQLVWKEAFRCGHAVIDRQHEQLFRRANELLEAVLSGRPKDELLLVVEKLVGEVGKHFADEEWILDALAFSGLQAHRVEHAGLMSRCHALVGDFEAGTVPVGEVFQFLAHELVTRHILGSDREYFPLTQMQPAS